MKPETITELEHIAIGIIHATRHPNNGIARSILKLYRDAIDEALAEIDSDTDIDVGRGGVDRAVDAG